MIVVALVLLIALPGAALASVAFRQPLPGLAWVSLAGACGLVWSVLGTFLLTLLHVPLSLGTLFLLGAVPVVGVLAFPALRFSARTSLAAIEWNAGSTLIWLMTVIVLAYPFLTVHRGLPTGDVQKSLYWSQQILEEQRIPSYSDALKLNRDPADFLTPGLHTLTAAVSAISGGTLRGSAWLSFVASIILAGLAAALAALASPSRLAPTIAFVFAALNLRYLRYAFSPGYHYQNLLGEVLLLFLLVVLLSLLRPTRDSRTRAALALLGLATLAALPLVHQFTAFLAVFFVGAAGATTALVCRKNIVARWKTLAPPARNTALTALMVGEIGALALFRTLPLAEKLPHVFTTTPHLAAFLIPISAYPELLGPSFLLFGLTGIVVTVVHARRSPAYPAVAILAVWTVTVLVLGQGPRFFVDIPSARTLFYAAVPLAVFCGLFLARTVSGVAALFPRGFPVLLPILLMLALAPLAQTAARELTAVTHNTRVNTTVTEDTRVLLNDLRARTPHMPGAILVDDWNRRRLTWAILSPYPMLTRVGGDLRVIAEESRQSPLRQQLYDAHLDFEKIFMLGNSPIIAPLLEKHRIALVGSSRGTTADVFAQNPLFRVALETPESVIYEQVPENPPATAKVDDPLAFFLLAPTTLANDVGDREDVLPHTAVSLFSTALSEPATRDGTSVRTIKSRESVIRVNVATYVRPRWDAQDAKVISFPTRLVLRAARSSARGKIVVAERTVGDFALPQGKGFSDIVVDIPAQTLRINNKGFVELAVVTTAGELTLDLVALGIIP